MTLVESLLTSLLTICLFVMYFTILYPTCRRVIGEFSKDLPDEAIAKSSALIAGTMAMIIAFTPLMHVLLGLFILCIGIVVLTLFFAMSWIRFYTVFKRFKRRGGF